MTAQGKQLWKSVGALITAGIFLIGLIFASGGLVQQNRSIQSTITVHDEKIGKVETRVQELETKQAVQEGNTANIKESIVRIERTTEETNKLIRDLLKERRK